MCSFVLWNIGRKIIKIYNTFAQNDEFMSTRKYVLHTFLNEKKYKFDRLCYLLQDTSCLTRYSILRDVDNSL